MTQSEFMPFSAVLERHQGDQGGDGGCRAAAQAGPPHHPLHRRNPPLQQSPAGCVPALRRARRHHPDRRHHREPVVRSERGAAFALEGLCAAARYTRGDRRPAGRALADERGLGDLEARLRTNCWSRLPYYGQRRRALGLQHAGGRRGGVAQGSNSRSRPSRTPWSARCCSTTRPAKSTTT